MRGILKFSVALRTNMQQCLPFTVLPVEQITIIPICAFVHPLQYIQFHTSNDGFNDRQITKSPTTFAQDKGIPRAESLDVFQRRAHPQFPPVPRFMEFRNHFDHTYGRYGYKWHRVRMCERVVDEDVAKVFTNNKKGKNDVAVINKTKLLIINI